MLNDWSGVSAHNLGGFVVEGCMSSRGAVVPADLVACERRDSAIRDLCGIGVMMLCSWNRCVAGFVDSGSFVMGFADRSVGAVYVHCAAV